jgi:hypothetical protein
MVVAPRTVLPVPVVGGREIAKGTTTLTTG